MRRLLYVGCERAVLIDSDAHDRDICGKGWVVVYCTFGADARHTNNTSNCDAKVGLSSCTAPRSESELLGIRSVEASIRRELQFVGPTRIGSARI